MPPPESSQPIDSVRRPSRLSSSIRSARIGTVCLVVISTLGAGTSPAIAARFKKLAVNVKHFATDGTRYAVWQGSSKDSPIIVDDIRTDHRGELLDGCTLYGDDPYRGAANGRFLASCGSAVGEPSSLLDVRTGAISPLPSRRYGLQWAAVGTHYVEGPAGNAGGLLDICAKPKPREACIALYDIATGKLSEVPESRVPDLDRAGAPSVCKPLRSRLLKLEREEIPDVASFSFADGTLAETEQLGEAPRERVRIERCHGRPMVLRTHREPLHIEVRGGSVTWDNAAEGEPYAHEQAHSGTLTSYDLSTRRLRDFPLPRSALDTSNSGVPGPIDGVFGYSVHTGKTLFWLATQSVTCGEEADLCSPATYRVFSASSR